MVPHLRRQPSSYLSLWETHISHKHLCLENLYICIWFIHKIVFLPRLHSVMLVRSNGKLHTESPPLGIFYGMGGKNAPSVLLLLSPMLYTNRDGDTLYSLHYPCLSIQCHHCSNGQNKHFYCTTMVILPNCFIGRLLIHAPWVTIWIIG
jgi:hypothetical protein